MLSVGVAPSDTDAFFITLVLSLSKEDKLKLMSRFFLSFFTFILSLGLYAQTPITYNKVKYYNGDSSVNDAVVRGIISLDTNYILVTIGTYNNKYYGTQIIKIDKYGKLLDVIHFNNDSIQYPTYVGNCIIKDSDTNIIIAINKHDVHYAYYNIWEGFLVKLNANLDTIWTRTLHLPDSLVGGCVRPNNHFTALALTPDGGYVVMGNYYKNCIYDENMKHPYLTKYDKNGNLLWIKTYINLYPCFDIAVTSDSGFVFSAARKSYYGLYVCKTDSLGNTEWFTQQINAPYLVSYDVKVSDDDIVSVFPYVYYSDGNPNNNRYGLDVVKTNSVTGQIIWNKQYIPMITVECPTLHQHLEVEVDDNENIIISATGHAQNYNHTAGGYKGFLMKLNSNGDSLWTHFYDWGSFFQRYAQFNDFVLTDDGGILAVGSWNPPYINYKQGAWLVKTDSMGNAPGMFTVSIEENELIISKNSLNIYPNPATENINLGFDKSTNENMELQIYNSSGALVKQQQLQAYAHEYRIGIQDLSVGVYFVHIESQEGEVFNSRFIKK